MFSIATLAYKSGTDCKCFTPLCTVANPPKKKMESINYLINKQLSQIQREVVDGTRSGKEVQDGFMEALCRSVSHPQLLFGFVTTAY